eukprot:gene33770-41660_t
MVIAFSQVLNVFAMPPPFTRELKVVSPYMTGNDVTIAQTLLKRDAAVSKSLVVDGVFGKDSQSAVSAFQSANALSVTGILDDKSATTLMNLYEADGFKDTGFTAESLGYKYKFVIPVHSNRSIETDAILYDAKNVKLLTFRVRTHGNRGDGTTQAWPDYGDGDVGLNQFTSNGNTITGLVEIDLNTPEPSAQLYGPYNVNRIVRGLDGNAKTLLPNIRDGQLIHTGDWSTSTVHWTEKMDMPNSSGCIHAHPSDVEKISSILISLGVTANKNPFSGVNYPYKPQGIAVIQS